jgi:phosphate starvation-inducible PhoH-like protein
MTQIDLPKNIESGLSHALKVLDGLEDIGFTIFNSKDVVRHPLVRKIVDAYDNFDQ